MKTKTKLKNKKQKTKTSKQTNDKLKKNEAKHKRKQNKRKQKRTSKSNHTKTNKQKTNIITTKKKRGKLHVQLCGRCWVLLLYLSLDYYNIYYFRYKQKDA